MSRMNDLQQSIEDLNQNVAALVQIVGGETAINDAQQKSQYINQVLWSGTLPIGADGTAKINIGGTFGSALVINHTGNSLWVFAGEPDATSTPLPKQGNHLVRPNTDLRLHIAGTTLGLNGLAGGIVGLQLFAGRIEL